MSSHIWNRKPTAERAMQLLGIYRWARRRKLAPNCAAAFAGYVMEAVAQSGGSLSISNKAISILRGLRRSGFRALQRREYGLIWQYHEQFGLPVVPDMWQLWHPQLLKEIHPEVYYKST